MAQNILNLLVIDENQLYAERIVELLSAYFDEVNLGFLDDKAEFVKALRQEWGVVVFAHAYDMSFTDVVGVLQAHDSFVPVIEVVADDAAVGELPAMMDGDMIKSLKRGEEAKLVLAICLLAANSQSRRQSCMLNAILKEAEQRANVLISNSKSAVAYIDQGVHIFANQPYLDMFGYKSMDELVGVPVVDIIATGDDIKAFKQFLRRFDKGDRSQVEFDFESKTRDGTIFASKLQLASATFDGEPVVQMIIQQNDSNAAEIAKKLAEVTRQDALTGLPNRIGFSEKLEEAYGDAQKGVKSTLVYVSIDDIGKVNSAAGLAGVDTTVKYLANLISEEAGDGYVGRFSDSTFAVLLFDTKKEKATAFAQKVLERTQNSLIETGSRTITVTLSIAVVELDANTPDIQTLLSRAIETIGDIANETDGQGNKVRLFDISEHASEDEGALVEYIQNALVQNRFVLKFQPTYDIETDLSDLFEVYVTLPMADGSELTFDKIVPIAAKNNLLDKIDRWVLINACKQLAQTRKTHPKASLLIALSAASLADGNLPKMVVQLVKAVGEQNDYPIVLQFHEQDLVDHLAVAKRQFMALTNIGCPTAIQNFGLTAKYEGVLEHLSPQMARLARNYTKDLEKPDNLEAVQALVAKAKEHGVQTLMPYIENAQSMSMAWTVGARYLQGNYLQPAANTLVYAEPSADA